MDLVFRMILLFVDKSYGVTELLALSLSIGIHYNLTVSECIFGCT